MQWKIFTIYLNHDQTEGQWIRKCQVTLEINVPFSTLQCAYSIAMPQCFPALSPAAWKPDRPIRATVGVMVRGPMYFSRMPGRPSAPIHTSTRDDTMIAPWIWQSRERAWDIFRITKELPTAAVFNFAHFKSASKRQRSTGGSYAEGHVDWSE